MNAIVAAEQLALSSEPVLFPFKRTLDYRVSQGFAVAASNFDEAEAKLNEFLSTAQTVEDSARFGVIQVSDSMDQINDSHLIDQGARPVVSASVVMQKSRTALIVDSKATQMHELLKGIANDPQQYAASVVTFLAALDNEVHECTKALGLVVAQALPEGVSVSRTLAPIDHFRSELAAIRVEHSTLIAELVAVVENSKERQSGFTDDLRLDVIDELKSTLGADCANACGDDESGSDDIISQAETWIEDHISNRDSAEIIAVAIWQHGAPVAEQKVRDSIA